MALLAAGCGRPPQQPGQSAGHAGIGSSLRRSLHIAHLAPGAPCPASPERRVGFVGPLAGPGPVYPVQGPRALTFQPRARAFAGSAWAGEKVAWVGDATYRGPVLIRARRIDGPQPAGFGDGPIPLTEMLLLESGATSPGEPAGWREWPSYTRVRGGGCYAYQVDGTDFSAVVYFRASLP